MNSECKVCQKHQNLSAYTGRPLLDKGGFLLTHFPSIPDEAAAKGHLLLESKRHLKELSDMNNEEASHLGPIIKAGSEALKKVLRAQHVYVFRINDKVEHLHFHLIPRYEETPKDYWGLKITQWPQRETLNLKEIQDLSDQLARSMTL